MKKKISILCLIALCFQMTVVYSAPDSGPKSEAEIYFNSVSFDVKNGASGNVIAIDPALLKDACVFTQDLLEELENNNVFVVVIDVNSLGGFEVELNDKNGPLSKLVYNSAFSFLNKGGSSRAMRVGGSSGSSSRRNRSGSSSVNPVDIPIPMNSVVGDPVVSTENNAAEDSSRSSERTSFVNRAVWGEWKVKHACTCVSCIICVLIALIIVGFVGGNYFLFNKRFIEKVFNDIFIFIGNFASGAVSGTGSALLGAASGIGNAMTYLVSLVFNIISCRINNCHTVCDYDEFEAEYDCHSVCGEGFGSCLDAYNISDAENTIVTIFGCGVPIVVCLLIFAICVVGFVTIFICVSSRWNREFIDFRMDSHSSIKVTRSFRLYGGNPNDVATLSNKTQSKDSILLEIKAKTLELLESNGVEIKGVKQILTFVKDIDWENFRAALQSGEAFRIISK